MMSANAQIIQIVVQIVVLEAFAYQVVILEAILDLIVTDATAHLILNANTKTV